MVQTALVPVFSGVLSNTAVQLCNARDLHAFMAVLRDFSEWIKGRIRKFGFVEGVDYLLTKSGEQVPHQGGTRTMERIDYHLSLDMAKELSMVENNAKGREARRYFIDCEKASQPAALAIAPPPVRRAAHLPRDAYGQPLALPHNLRPEVQALVNRRAWALSQVAYERLADWLARRAAHSCNLHTSTPERIAQCLEQIDFDQWASEEFSSQAQGLLLMAESAQHLSAQLAAQLRAALAKP